MKSIHWTIFLISLVTMTYQLLLTRVFSVTMWYHYAFAVISIAMFGLTVGALLVYLRPVYFDPHIVRQRLALWSVALALSIPTTFILQLGLPFSGAAEASLLFELFVMLSVIYLLIGIPFVISGVLICLCLTQFPRNSGTLYAVDLVGQHWGRSHLF